MWWFAFALFTGFALLTIVSVLHQLMVLGAHIVYFSSLIFGRGSGRGKAFIEYIFLAGANIIQLFEMGIMVVFTLVIYRALYPL
jgi:hypothetical protein